jgi:hypothetical protein
MQLLTLILDGITADDYLSWVRDPEPAALGHALRQLHVRADRLGDRIELQLLWEGEQLPHTRPQPPQDSRRPRTSSSCSASRSPRRLARGAREACLPRTM